MSVEKIFSEVFVLPESSVMDSLALSDIPTWDSLTHMMLIVRLEESYQMQFTGDEIADIKSVGDARAALQAHGAEL
jgi:acyl carrier protein